MRKIGVKFSGVVENLQGEFKVMLTGDKGD